MTNFNDIFDRYDELMTVVNTDIVNTTINVDIISEMGRIEDLFAHISKDLCISKIDGTGEPDDDYSYIQSYNWTTTSNNNIVLELTYKKNLNVKRKDGIYIFNLDKETDEETELFKIGRKVKLKKNDENIVDRWSYISIENYINLKMPISHFKCNCNSLECFIEYMQWETY